MAGRYPKGDPRGNAARYGGNNQTGQPKPWDTFGTIIAEIISGPWPPPQVEGETTKRRMCRVMIVKAAGGDLPALNWIAERAEGKVPDILQMDANVRNDSPVRQEEVTEIMELLRRRNGAETPG